MVQQTGDNRFGITKWIVGSSLSDGATHTTIAGAISAASSGDVIFIKPGTYTENLTLIDGITLTAFSNILKNQPKIVGKVSMSSGEATINGLWMATNGDYALEVTSTGDVYCSHCKFDGDDNTIFNCTSSAGIQVKNSTVNLNTTGIALHAQTAGNIFYTRCSGGNGGSSTTASTTSGGTVWMSWSSLPFNFETSSTGRLLMIYTELSGGAKNLQGITTAGTGTTEIYHCRLTGGTSSAISVGSGTTVKMSNCSVDSTNTNPVTGAGTVVYSAVEMINTGKIINTTTKTERSLIAGQISFDSGSNYLDTYEEGTWTPTVVGTGTAGTASYSVQNAWYQRTGSVVRVKWRVDWTAGNGAGSLRVAGLPFTAHATAYGGAAGSLGAGSNLTISANANQLSAEVVASSTEMNMSYNDYNTSWSSIAYDGTGSCWGTCTYLV